MQAYDVFMLAILAACVVWGAWKGLAWQVTSLGSIAASYVVSSMGADWFSRNVLPKLFKPPAGTERYVSMLIIYVACSLFVWLGFNLVRDFIERFKLKEFDRQIGALLGAAKGGLVCVLVTLFTVGVSQPATRDAVFRSQSGPIIARALDVMAPMIPGDFRAEIAPYVRKLEAGLENDRFRRGDDRYGDDEYADDRYRDEPGYGSDDRYRDEPYDDRYDDRDRAPYRDRYQDEYDDGHDDRSSGRSSGYDRDYDRRYDDRPGDFDARRDRRTDDHAGSDEADDGLWSAVEKIGETVIPEVEKALGKKGRR